ncbi:MAG TPA: twin-arginine translocase subunit TatC, partial [Solirubrobacteraceae bacterium]|nr:twin-arginine translocase subunit TatC [Solirubrobacteraceae bacterium]
MARVRPIGHDDRLSIVDHLDELRSRLFVCLAVLAVAFGLCFWQNNHLLTVLNRALPDNSTSASHGLASVPSESVQLQRLFTKQAAVATALANAPGTSAQARQAYLQEAAAYTQTAKTLPESVSNQEKPITIGVGESFTTTLTVAAYFALLFSLPILIYEGYAFVIPALSQTERRAAYPVMAAAPLLFLAGVVFTYLVVLPPAVHFLQGYNADQFQVLVQAKSYYSFQILTMLAVGLAF